MSGWYFAGRASELLDPRALAAISGFEFIDGMRTGRYPAPPIAEPMGMRLVEVERGRVVFEGRPGFSHYNPLGAAHGGWFGTLLDSCMACAVQTMLPAGRTYTTLEYRVNILRAVTVETGPLLAEGTALRVGRRTGVAEGRLTDGDGRLCATGSTTCLVFALAGGEP